MLTRRKRNGSQVSLKDMSTTPGEPYKSPQYKLVRFFEKSRTQWKTKCRAAKATIKVLQSRIRFLEESRQRWKHRAKALEQEVARVATAGRVAVRERQALKKNGG